MKTIKLEIPNDDAITQKYFGEALVNMAYHRQHGKPREVVSFEQQMGRASRQEVKPLDIEGLEKAAPETLPESPFGYIDDEPTVQLPWDERIHSGNKTQNQDGSWKMRKKPKDMASEQWQEYIESVEAELTTLMSIPVETVEEPNQYPIYWRHDGDDSVGIVHNDEEYNQIFNTQGCIIDEISEKLFNELRINTPEQDFEDTPNSETVVEAVEPPVVVVPKPQDATPPPPPVTDVAPVGNTQDGVEAVSGMTFVQLVQKMSSICNGDSDKSARIKEAIKEKYDVDFPALLKRPDLIPQVAAFLSTVEV